MAADTIYMAYNGINAANRQLCIIYCSLPRWAFFTWEYIIELLLVVLVGVFAGVLIEHYSKKIKRFYPKNPFLAFVYASIIPVCSCGVIPVIDSLKGDIKLKTIITFVIAAPLLNPYIIFISFSVLGWEYALIRIAASFVIAVGGGFLAESVFRKFNLNIQNGKKQCSSSCAVHEKDLFVKTLKIMRKLLPYIIIAGALTLSFEFLTPKRFLETLNFSNEPLSMALMLVVGIPIYVCNGADVLFLRPLLEFTDLSLASAMIFSLASSSVCISSIVMLAKYLGRKQTAILIGILTVLIFGVAFTINVVSGIMG